MSLHKLVSEPTVSLRSPKTADSPHAQGPSSQTQSTPPFFLSLSFLPATRSSFAKSNASALQDNLRRGLAAQFILEPQREQPQTSPSLAGKTVMAPPNANTSPARPAPGQRRVVPAIPLQFPRSQQRRRAGTNSLSQELPTPAKSEKSDTTSGDERHTSHGMAQQPMTPESLTSSLHKTDGSVFIAQEEGGTASEKEQAPVQHVNGEFGY